MLELFDRNRRKIAILQNAFNISEDIKINAICYFEFSLPYNDDKNTLCQPYCLVRYNNGELYRVLPTTTSYSETGGVSYKCEHVLALLMDNILFGDHVVGNRGYYTPQVINYVLSKQLTKNWILDKCDFNREFEYGWTQETLLSALFSVSNVFTEKFMWTYDTKSYPYKLSLIKLNENINPQMYIRAKKNMLQLNKTSDPTDICTRIYPLGEGEGVNQLNIASINNGKYYIDSPQSYIDKYGIIERAWIDRRYTNQESLKNAALAMLTELQEPFEEYQVDFALLGNDNFDVPEIGKIVEIVGYKKTFITGIRYKYDEVPTCKLTIANKPKDIASTVANLADRQRIEMAYSQGATQFYQDHVYENATPDVSLLLKLMIPSTMKIINSVNIDIDISAFRKPFSVTGGGGGQTIAQSNTNSSGASTTTTTASGGGQTSGSSSINTTSSGGGQTSGSSSINTTSSGGGQTSGSSSINTTSSGGGQTSGSSSINTTTSGGGQTSGSSSINTTSSGGYGSTPSSPASVMWGPQYGYAAGNIAIGPVSPYGVEVKEHYHGFNPLHSHELPSHTHDMNHNHYINDHTHDMSHTHNINSHTHDMSHTHNINSHTHNMSHTHNINAHTHNMSHTHNISSHTHDMKHTHSIAHTHIIPDHTHNLTPAITFSGNPSSFKLLLDGKEIKNVVGQKLQMDITSFLVDTQNKIPRDKYINIEVVPNDTAFVMLTVNLQGFIQSRGDYSV